MLNEGWLIADGASTAAGVWVYNPDVMKLVELSLHRTALVRKLVAEHDSTPISILERLSRDPDPDVRISAAENPSVPYDSLVALVRDPSADVRFALAENSNLPVSILAALGFDENPYVAWRARETLDRSNAARSIVPMAPSNCRVDECWPIHERS